MNPRSTMNDDFRLAAAQACVILDGCDLKELRDSVRRAHDARQQNMYGRRPRQRQERAATMNDCKQRMRVHRDYTRSPSLKCVNA